MLEWAEAKAFSYMRDPRWAADGLIHGFADASTPDDNKAILSEKFSSLAQQHKRSGNEGEAVTCELRRLEQVHGAEILQPDTAPEVPVGDGWYFRISDSSRTSSRVLLVRTADCLPIIVYSVAARCGAILHCGWRGIIAGIASKAVRELECSPSSLSLAVGPGIGVQNYEVSEDVARAFRKRAAALGLSEPGDYLVEDERGALRLNLERFLVEEFRALGLSSDSISCSGVCTYQDQRFFSHRRQGLKRARQVSFVFA